MKEKDLKDQLRQTFDFTIWKDILPLFFKKVQYFTVPNKLEYGSDKVLDAVQLGVVQLDDEKRLAIVVYEVDDTVFINRNRVELRKIAIKPIDEDKIHGALAFFYNKKQADYRFSFIAKESSLDLETGQLIKGETKPKRFTYLLGSNEACTTAAKRMLVLIEKNTKGKVTIQELKDVFSVEALNKDFFKSYKEYFERFSAHLADESTYKALMLGDKAEHINNWKDEGAKPIRDFVKKLMGRIVFLQFLQKKGWMGVPITNDYWIGGDGNFLQNQFLKFEDKEHFHSKVLKVLFYETLNKKRTNDLAPSELGAKIKIPYLNGGLFDRDASFENDVDFPSDLFNSLLEFFASYNFTIDENSPDDHEVGIDPEMLGHIFENLLEENREKGAFYTPKEIVHYMCQESLIQYLRTHMPECTEDESPATIALQNFIRHGKTGDRNDKKNFVVQQAKRIEKLLDNVKICDPAIGSGAFPMGMLQEIFKAKTTLDLTLDHAEVKKQIIQNCIYGVDIDNGAVEIARLRFWLALVVDEDEPQPLPNLDYKIMQGNSLLESFEGIDLSKVHTVTKTTTIYEPQRDLFGRITNPQMKITDVKVLQENDLQQLMIDFFRETDPEKKQKQRHIINQTVHDHIDYNMELSQLSLERQIAEAPSGNQLGIKAATKKKIDLLKKSLDDLIEKRKKLHALQNTVQKPYFLWHLFFADVFDKGGFDIVIGNPPYIEHKKLKDIAYLLKEKYQVYSGATDISAYFFELGFKLLNKKGTLQYISSNKFFNTGWGKELRKYLLGNTIDFFVNFEQVEVFEGVLVSSVIVGGSKELPQNNHKIKYIEFYKDKKWKANFHNHIKKTFQLIKQNSFDENEWSFANEIDLALKRKIELSGEKIKNFDTIDIKRGVTTGYDPAFIIENNNEIPKNSETVVKLLIKGRDIKRYLNPESKSILLFIPWHFPLNNDPSVNGASEEAEQRLKSDYPELYKHLKSHHVGLSKRNKEETGIRYEWYALQRCAASYFEQFEKEKIVWPLTADKWGFAIDSNKHYLTSGGFFMVSESIKLLYIVGVLNSKLLEFYFKFIGVMTAGGAYTLKKATIDELPLINPNQITSNYIEKLVSKIIELKKEKLSSSIYENKIDALVFHLYGLTEQEMLQVLDTFKDLSIKDRNQIQNEYWNIGNNKFQLDI
ncbi:MAG: Eco57I restriction-modification methylase domain-containing protein [Saprospiraceae bacterium]|nr:Eco57I restriction-modification methylase domain-containing protein [Saprospiraceae bacterium]